jgi:glycine/D-amino acid oxidase-like deaminating enzyme
MDVLVVGAGPTGLLMAAELARHRLEARVIDRDEHGATESRALAIQARTVELLDDLGLAAAFLARGLRASEMTMWSGSGERIVHGAPRPGDLAPEAGPELRAALRGPEHVLLVLDGDPAPVVERYGALVRAVSAPAARDAYGGAALCLVRPDGYVAYVAGDADGDALRGYLDTVLIAPSP